MKSFLIALVIILMGQSFAAEVDAFTNSHKDYEDISEFINAFSNSGIEDSVKKANLKIENCNSSRSEKVLYKELTKYFANHSKGKLVKRLLYSDDIPKVKTPLLESVYSSFTTFDGKRLGGRAAKKSKDRLSPVIRVGDQLIGIDKLEHMFGMGHIYFKGHYLKNKKLKRVLKNGIFREKIFLGGQMFATGVFSFGDLGANFNGMRFWNHMLLKESDVLGKEYNLGPYIKCVDNKFLVNQDKPLDFRNYVDASMDETINCPKFARKTAAKKFLKAIEELGMTCPMSKEALEQLKNKYSATTPKDPKKRPISHWILNTEKVEDVSYYNEF
jgi:hypothetical protein